MLITRDEKTQAHNAPTPLRFNHSPHSVSFTSSCVNRKWGTVAQTGYTKSSLHKDYFTQSRFLHIWTVNCVQTSFARRPVFYNDIFFYTDSLWHRATFTRETLCTEQLLHGTFFYNQRPFYTQALSRKPGFAQSSFCTKTLWRRAASSQRSVHTHTCLTQRPFTPALNCRKLQ